VRERMLNGHLTLLCQMLAGCASTAAGDLTGTIPAWDDGANFVDGFSEWMNSDLAEKGSAFADLQERQRVRLEVVSLPIRAA
jgi:hypothetical protein